MCGLRFLLPREKLWYYKKSARAADSEKAARWLIDAELVYHAHRAALSA